MHISFHQSVYVYEACFECFAYGRCTSIEIYSVAHENLCIFLSSLIVRTKRLKRWKKVHQQRHPLNRHLELILCAYEYTCTIPMYECTHTRIGRIVVFMLATLLQLNSHTNRESYDYTCIRLQQRHLAANGAGQWVASISGHMNNVQPIITASIQKKKQRRSFKILPLTSIEKFLLFTSNQQPPF